MADAVNVFPPGFRLTDAAGAAISNATVEFYDAGTTTQKSVYADKDLTTSLGYTVHTDTGGYPVVAVGSTAKTVVFTDTSPYKIIIKDASGVPVATHDNMVGAVVSGGGGGTDGITEAEGDARYVRNPIALTAATGFSDTDTIPFWAQALSANRGITWANLKADLIAELKTTGDLFSTGVSTVFFDAAAPVGWTKDTTHNNKAMRIVNTSGGGSGGSTSFTSVFSARTIAQANLPNVTLSGTTVGGGSHSHQVTILYYGLTEGGSGSVPAFVIPGSGVFSGSAAETTDSEASHVHNFTTSSINGGVTQTTFDMAVQYVDAIICNKD